MSQKIHGNQTTREGKRRLGEIFNENLYISEHISYQMMKELTNLRKLIAKAKKKGVKLNSKIKPEKTLHNFSATEHAYLQTSIKKSIKDLANKIDHPITIKLKSAQTLEEIESFIHEIENLELKPRKTNITRLPPLPSAVKGEIEADFEELIKCFNNKLYRSATILCGRILEVALHRKYYEMTGKDILETSPGIGLGKLVAKLKERKTQFPPGVTQQIHLVNQVRIESVHKKGTVFKPTKQQTHAIILYTLDILKKLF